MSTPFTQSRVSKAVWPWMKQNRGTVIKKPSVLFSLIPLLVGSTMAAWVYYHSHTVLAYCILSVSLFVFVSSQFFPSIYNGIQKVFHGFSYVVGTCVTWVLLVPFFYICMPLIGAISKITGKSPLQRTIEVKRVSYWQNCIDNRSIDDYKRQF